MLTTYAAWAYRAPAPPLENVTRMPAAVVTIHRGDLGTVDFHGQQVDVVYSDWTGRPYLEAVADCDHLGGEPVAYSWAPADAGELTCQDIDY